MITEKRILSEKYPDCTLISYIHEPFEELQISKRRAVIVFPGGGYQALSEREGEPVALQFFAAGFNAFVLRYSVGQNAAFFSPMIEAALAVKYVKENADTLHVDPDYVFTCGFSAGGHLAAASGAMWNIPEVRAALGDAPEGIGKPCGTILCYALITSSEYTDTSTLRVLCHGDAQRPATQEDADRFSVDKYVDDTTVPSFIWATSDDQVVKIQNSLIYAKALADKKIPFELHVYPHGTHGLALCNKETWSGFDCMLNPAAEAWIKDAVRWAEEL